VYVPHGLIIEKTELGNVMDFLSEGGRCGLDKEISPDGTYLTYFPFGLMIEKTELGNVMDFSIEGGRCGLDKEISPDG
jgi:hypothetical protein